MALAIAGVLICISGAFHLTALLVGGVHVSTILFLPVGLIYLAIGRSYLGRSDLWVWPGLGFMVLGSGVVLLMLWLGSGVPHWWLKPILWVDVATALCLIWYLLRG